jgi:cytoskeletal protein CcmA (bactofilin family)
MGKMGKVTGDLRVTPGETLIAEGPAGIEVEGAVFLEKDAQVVGNLSCASLSMPGRGTLDVQGSLQVRDAVSAPRGEVRVSGDLSCRRLEVGRETRVGGSLRTESAECGGVLEVAGNAELTASLEVGGSLVVRGLLRARDLDVGGKADLGSAELSGRIEVGGIIRVRERCDFTHLEAGGKILLGGPNRGASVEVGGMLETTGDLTLSDSLEAGGIVRVSGTLETGSLEVGGVLDVRRLVAKKVEVGGSLRAEAEVRAERLEVGGRMDAQRAYIEDLCELSGHVSTRDGIKARTLRLGHDSRVSGPLVAERLEAAHQSRLEDVWAQEGRLEHDCRVRNLYGRRLELERDVRAEGEIQYVESLHAEPPLRAAHEPRQVSSLPPAPLS